MARKPGSTGKRRPPQPRYERPCTFCGKPTFTHWCEECNQGEEVAEIRKVAAMSSGEEIDYYKQQARQRRVTSGTPNEQPNAGAN